MKRQEVNCKTGEVVEINLTAEEIAAFEAASLQDAWQRLRTKRNNYLADSDWTQNADSPVDKYTWAEYRQQLRDLPANTTDPFDPVWPTPPA